MSGTSNASRTVPPGIRSSFMTRSATDDAAQLGRRSSALSPPAQSTEHPSHSEEPDNPYEPETYSSQPSPRHFEFTKKVFGQEPSSEAERLRNNESKRSHGLPFLKDHSLTAQMHGGPENKGRNGNDDSPRGVMPRPVGGKGKLGTFSGVFVPTSLNVLSILMFLRFGFILGQGGVLGTMGMLLVSYLINLVTTLSISAIATNGTVRGGGAYYLISRSLGPEFGGSIGIVFYLGFVFNTGMNAVGLVDCLKQNFGVESGNWYNWLPDGFWWDYLWATILLLLCTSICLAGSSIFARASNGLLAILLIATFSIPLSAFIVQPFTSSKLGIEYTGLSAETFMGNMLPKFTKGAAGSQLHSKENFQDLFGILFPATGGIFAGASMSGDLKHPSKAIPKGTLSGLALTFFAYTVVILAMAATITRASLYRNVNVIQDTNISAVLVLLGEFSTSFFSSLMGVIGSAKLLQALARDNLIPGFSIFGQGTKKGDEPTYGILITHIAAQLTMLLNINHIASFVTMTYLMTFLVTNLACFLLKISSAPNFRPSFHYFNWETALAGTLISGVLMFFVDGAYATGCVGILVVIFLIIHYTTPPKSWGDVSQSLIYHQVRKYLLRLRQEHVKFWRPQILLFINDPRRQYKLIQFCNSMKKGALYILGHVIVTPDFASSVPEARRQQAAWTKYIDFSKVKAFVNIAISPAVEWGTRNIVLSAGLGGMRPNIAVLAFYNLDEYRKRQPLVDVPEPQSTGENHSDNNRNQEPTSARNLSGTQNADQANGDDFTGNALPTDTCRTESAMSVQSYVTILEDLLLSLQINVALAKGFQNLEFPQPDGENSKKYIDLWPIQMSAEIGTENNDKGNVLTTNFDTYTLILQLGCILDTVPAWKKKYSLRVGVFVEYESDVEEERKRVKTLLSNLRIQAEVLVYWLASGDLKTYQIIVNGADSGNDVKSEHNVDEVLREEEWWLEIQKLRGKRGSPDTYDDLAAMEGFFSQGSNWPGSSFLQGPRTEQEERLQGLKRLINRTKRRPTLGGLTRLGVNLGMRTHRLSEDLVKSHDAPLSASENEDSESSEGSDDGRFHDEEDLSSRRRTSAATENDLDLSDHDKTESSGLAKSLHPSKVIRRRSYGDSISGPSSATRSGARENAQDALKAASKAPAAPSVDVSDKSDTAPINTSSSEAPRPSGSSKPASRPTTVRQSSMAKFSSKPVPMTTVATEDGPGPSIMFTDTPSPPAPHPGQSHRRSIYDSHQASPRRSTSGTAASGFPSSQSVPLTFNDLPCRAQHLILNELIQHQSARDTAVVFTTLPSPVQGTCRSEADSLRYLSDLEVLCQGLPPVLLVHSNSLTVTMNL